MQTVIKNHIKAPIVFGCSNWRAKINKGIYMGGTIQPDMRKNLCACGGTFKQVVNMGQRVPLCDQCEKPPGKLRVVRYMPGINGKGKYAHIRRDELGARIENIFQAIHVNKIIDDEMSKGIFDPRKYAGKEFSEQLLFKSFSEKEYLAWHFKRQEKGEITYKGYREKVGLLSNHLMPFFEKLSVKDIKTSLIRKYFEMHDGSERQRDRSIEELRCILTYAKEHEIIDVIPIFPKTKKSKIRDVEKFLTVTQQNMVISNISDPTYKAMIEVLALYGIRPCEVRALQWHDLDFKNKVIKIKRHFSNGNKLIEGRKSQKTGDSHATHYLPMLPRFSEIIKDFPVSINSKEFLFKGKIKEFVSEKALLSAWNNACKLSGHKSQLYEGTKHVLMSYLKSLGYTNEQLILITGHTNTDVIKRYAQLTNNQELSLVRDMLES